jgi:hypothetical protein
MADGLVVEDVVVTWSGAVVKIGGSEHYSLDPSQVVDAQDRSAVLASRSHRSVVSSAGRLRSRARLPEVVRARIFTFPQDPMGFYHVALVMADGSVLEVVVVAWGDEVIKIGGSKHYSLDTSQVVDAQDRSAVLASRAHRS